MNYNQLTKHLKVEKNHIYAKEDCLIRIADEDFKKMDEEMVDVSDKTEISDNEEELQSSISIPCSFTIECENTLLEIYLPFNVNLMVHDKDRAKQVTTYYYKKDDLIFCAFTKTSDTNISRVASLFNNSVKYLSGNVDKQLLEIHNQMVKTSNTSMHHLEVLLSQLYIDDTGDHPIPLRLTNKDYSKEYAVNAKTSAHKLLSDAHAFDFGYTNDAISHGISSDSSYNLKSDIDRIISGEF